MGRPWYHVLHDAMVMDARAHRVLIGTLALLLGAATIVLPHAAASAATNEVVTRVVRAYALTSANDFPERDPQDWRLLGSNNRGETWTVLDTRSGELFPKRHQRRIFEVANPRPFNLYRLEISRVHAPAAADAVQLAEIEPLNETANGPDPTPLFCDTISAQGENPPCETACQAFDGQRATKWLDFAVAHPATRSSWIQWCYLDQSALVLTNAQQLRALRARAAEAYPVQFEGTVADLHPAESRLCVVDGTGFVDVVLPGPLPDAVPGQRILLKGTSQWREGRAEVRSPEIRLLDPPAPRTPALIQIEQPFPPADEFQWVEAEGQIQFATRNGGLIAFDLIDHEHRLSVQVLHSDPATQPPVEGSRARVRGLCCGILNEAGLRVAGTMLVSSMDSVDVLPPSNFPSDTREAAARLSPAPARESILTKIDQVRRLSLAELAAMPRVRVRGVITDTAGGCIQDPSGGIELALHKEATWQAQDFGSFVEVEGHAALAPGHGPTGKGPAIEVERIHRLGPGKLPNPLRPSWGLLSSGQTDAQWVEVDAVVRATDGSHLLLACEGGQLMGTVRAAPNAVVGNLVDATIRVRGISLAANDARGERQSGIELLIPSLAFIQVLQPPTDLAQVPLRKISSLRQIRGSAELTHRVKLACLLTGMDNNRYFVQDESGGALAIAKEDVLLSLSDGGWWTFWQTPRSNAVTLAHPSLHIGDSVEITGFPETGDFAPVLTEAILRPASPLPPVLPVRATVEELGRGELDSTLVTLEGLVQGSEPLGPLFVLQIQSGLKTFRAILPGAGRRHLRLAPGSRIQVTGVCQLEPVSHAELGKRPADFSLRLRDAGDVTLLERPPWLSVRRTLAAVGALSFVLLVAFGWIRLLQRQVALRTTQLEQRILEHQKTETLLAGKTRLLEEEIEHRKGAQAEVEKVHKQLLTASRMAGMADVATNVLHNVGNVLNSVNVLAASITTHLKKSRVGSVSRLAALLNEHQVDLGRFVTEDSVGRHVPDHLERLGDHLEQEQTRLLEKVKALSESVDHIKEIVAMQQNYAKVSGLRETVSVVEIVEDALGMCSGALARHQITVSRDYEPVPPVLLDRHKTLQILFNLLDNARHACWETHRPDRQISVKVKRCDSEHLHIEVADNGVGIAPANLKQIFTQGFTTRKNGHGFGLHSSILAAQDMGGTLTVRPNDPEPGATFTLQIPLILSQGPARSGSL